LNPLQKSPFKVGLSPEYVRFEGGKMQIPGDGAYNILRPEAIESIYYMWYYTGDDKYRVWAKEMFMAF
jgi:hypothetical protein